MSWIGWVTTPFTPLHKAAPTACDPDANPMENYSRNSTASETLLTAAIDARPSLERKLIVVKQG